MFFQSNDVFSEVFTNCLELSFIDVTMNGYEIILEYGVEVGTNIRLTMVWHYVSLLEKCWGQYMELKNIYKFDILK